MSYLKYIDEIKKLNELITEYKVKIKYLELDISKKIDEIIKKNIYIEQLENNFNKNDDLEGKKIKDLEEDSDEKIEEEDLDENLENDLDENLENDLDENEKIEDMEMQNKIWDIDLPWRVYSDKELQDEYMRLKRKLRDSLGSSFECIPYSAIGCKCTNYFFQYERLNTPSIWKTSSVEFWNNNKDKVILFSKNKKDLYTTLNFYNHTPGQFLVMTAAKLYKYFNVKKIFDPYAGWGDRCLAAMALDINYTGVDSNTNLIEPYNKIISFYDTKSIIKMFFQKSETIDIELLDFDFVFSSPPFWKDNKMVENYNNSENDYKIFMNTSLIPIVKKCLLKNIWVCLYIPENMYNDLKLSIGECNKIIKFKSCSTRHGNIYCWK